MPSWAIALSVLTTILFIVASIPTFTYITDHLMSHDQKEWSLWDEYKYYLDVYDISKLVCIVGVIVVFAWVTTISDVANKRVKNDETYERLLKQYIQLMEYFEEDWNAISEDYVYEAIRTYNADIMYHAERQQDTEYSWEYTDKYDFGTLKLIGIDVKLFQIIKDME